MVERTLFLYAEFMAYIKFQNNPKHKATGDCVVRALSILTGMTWEQAYINVCAQGYKMAEMPSTNSVWGAYLRELGYVREALPNTCPDCYTIKEFCDDHPRGQYAVATGTHVVAVVDGDYLDAWDSGNETPIYFWRRS